MRSTKKIAVMAAAIIAVSVGVGAIVLSQEKRAEVSDDVLKLVSGGSPVLGRPDAELTIVEWGDYQCTYCYRFHKNTKDLLFNDFVETGKARFVFRDFPLNGLASALAAEASYCANDQKKYWEYHDEVYDNWAGENTGWVTTDSLKKFAANVGLDVETFDKCLQGHKYRLKVTDNYDYGLAIGINATPTFIVINNEGKAQVIKGAQPYEVYQKVLNDMPG